MASDTMRKGILRECIGICTAGMGQLAIKDSETHKIELVLYEPKPTLKALHHYKGKEIYWDLDDVSMLARLEPVKDL